MTRKSNKWAKLDGLDNLTPRLYKQGEREGQRKIGTSKADAVSDAMAECVTPSDVAELAQKFGLTDDEIMHRAEVASNFGQFRMVIGNRIRGVCHKIEVAKEQGVELSVQDAAASKKLLGAKAKVKAKAGKKTAAKKATKKTAGRGKRAARVAA